MGGTKLTLRKLRRLVKAAGGRRVSTAFAGGKRKDSGNLTTFKFEAPVPGDIIERVRLIAGEGEGGLAVLAVEVEFADGTVERRTLKEEW